MLFLLYDNQSSIIFICITTIIVIIHEYIVNRIQTDFWFAMSMASKPFMKFTIKFMDHLTVVLLIILSFIIIAKIIQCFLKTIKYILNKQSAISRK